MENEYLYSWLRIHKSRPVRKVFPQSISELQSLLAELKSNQQPYNFVGSSHSYNAIQCVDDNIAIIFDGNALKGMSFDPTSKEVTVECGVTIEELKLFLVKYERHLLTSGNYMQQKVIGALLTGTHGYGSKDTIMADGITSARLITADGEIIEITDEETLKYLRVSFGYLGLVVSVTLRTKGNEQYRVQQRLLPLSKLEAKLTEVGDGTHALILFPYSHRQDPTVGFVRLNRLDEFVPPTKVRRGTPVVSAVKWLIIKFLWALDARFEGLRPITQGIVKFLEGHLQLDVITSPTDLDYLYDFTPLLERKKDPMIAQQLFSSVYTANNVAFFIPRGQLTDFLRFIHALGNRLRNQRPREFLKNIVGVRYVGKSAKCALAGNFNVDSYAIDLYFNKDDLALAESVQRQIADNFSIRPHWGKSILRPYVLDHLDRGLIEKIRLLRSEYSEGSLLRPNLGDISFDFGQNSEPDATISRVDGD